MLFEWKKNKQIKTDTNRAFLGFANSFIGNYGLKIYVEKNQQLLIKKQYIIVYFIYIQ